jgi:hypothetical protein
MKNLTQEEKIMVSKLLSEIQDGSLQMILRNVIFTDHEGVEEIIMRNRPEYGTSDIDKLKR